MKPTITAAGAIFCAIACGAIRTRAADPAWVPAGLLPPEPKNGPALCPGAFLTPEQGREVLAAATREFSTREKWDAYAAKIRTMMQRGMNLDPWPRKTPLRAIIRPARHYDGYTVQSVAFESVPGFFVTGSLYRPLGGKPPYAAVLTPHGHTSRITKPADYDTHGRFSPEVQTRAAGFARMGAVVFAIDMFGCDDSIPQVGQDAHAHPFTMTIQVWDAIRAIDFLTSLDDVDPHRVAMTGESGGGTLSFLVTALDPRVAVSVPVVMVGSYFFGGCPCESGLPIHRGNDYFADNAMIAATAAPRPMLVVSDGADWTKETPTVTFPFLQHIYALEGAADNVANVHLGNEGHDYGPSKRAAADRFLAKRLGLNLAAVEDAAGKIDESGITIEPAAKMHVFDATFPRPQRALQGAAAVEHALMELQEPATR
ncbi:MAG TPA: acetylxylan esterase [Opitutus sp.]|nr:acetylxylan esterase [Opitutus sp.]